MKRRTTWVEGGEEKWRGHRVRQGSTGASVHARITEPGGCDLINVHIVTHKLLASVACMHNIVTHRYSVYAISYTPVLLLFVITPERFANLFHCHLWGIAKLSIN